MFAVAFELEADRRIRRIVAQALARRDVPFFVEADTRLRISDVGALLDGRSHEIAHAGGAELHFLHEGAELWLIPERLLDAPRRLSLAALWKDDTAPPQRLIVPVAQPSKDARDVRCVLRHDNGAQELLIVPTPVHRLPKATTGSALQQALRPRLGADRLRALKPEHRIDFRKTATALWLSGIRRVYRALTKKPVVGPRIRRVRVRTRRLREIIRFLAPIFPTKPLLAFREGVAELGRRLGEIRSAQALVEQLDAFPEHAATTSEIRRRIVGRIARRCARLVGYVESRAVLEHALDGVDLLLVADFHRFDLDDLVVRYLRRHLPDFAQGRAALDDPQAYDAQHDVRIALKRLRYGLEVFGSAYPEHGLAELPSRVQRVQQALGVLNDDRELLAFLQRPRTVRLAGEGHAELVAKMAVRVEQDWASARGIAHEVLPELEDQLRRLLWDAGRSR